MSVARVKEPAACTPARLPAAAAGWRGWLWRSSAARGIPSVEYDFLNSDAPFYTHSPRVGARGLVLRNLDVRARLCARGGPSPRDRLPGQQGLPRRASSTRRRARRAFFFSVTVRATRLNSGRSPLTSSLPYLTLPYVVQHTVATRRSTVSGSAASRSGSSVKSPSALRRVALALARRSRAPPARGTPPSPVCRVRSSAFGKQSPRLPLRVT